ncbi:hypothetical protein BGY98DRAFT_586617 [Russula aff. rugulosa BPL654]|nr:hypothetical protein BGY98DRAFT_586617 [Russula aff. rugulosa BPL654]
MVASPSSSVLSNSSTSSLTPTSSTPSTCTITPATYAAATATVSTSSSSPTLVSSSSHRPYPLSASAAHASGAAARTSLAGGDPADPGAVLSPHNPSRIPVTPAVLRSIFASSRSPGEERSLSRIAFFRFSGFIISCLAISLMANQGRGIRTGAALLGVGV